RAHPVDQHLDLLRRCSTNADLCELAEAARALHVNSRNATKGVTDRRIVIRPELVPSDDGDRRSETLEGLRDFRGRDDDGLSHFGAGRGRHRRRRGGFLRPAKGRESDNEPRDESKKPDHCDAPFSAKGLTAWRPGRSPDSWINAAAPVFPSPWWQTVT